MGPERTVLELANAQPRSLRVLVRHGIDVLDEAGSTLDEACRRGGLDADALLEEISREPGEDLPPSADWSAASDPALLDHILETFHRPLQSALPRLENLARAAYRTPDGDRRTLSRILRTFRRLRDELELHVRTEERVLFPLLRRGESHMAQAPIARMLEEHGDVRVHLRELRGLTHGFHVPEDAGSLYGALCRGLADLEEDLTRHMLIENTELYRRAALRERGA